MNENNKSGGRGERKEEAMSDEALVTAYALGELDGAECAANRARVEALIASDGGLRDEIERIREVAGELQRELALEAAGAPEPALTAEQRRTIESELAGPPVRGLRPWLMAAASIAAIALILWQLRPIDRTGMPASNLTGPVAMGGKDELRDKLVGMNDVRNASASNGSSRAAEPESGAKETAGVAQERLGRENSGLDEAEGMLVDMDNQRSDLQDRAAEVDKLKAENTALAQKVEDLQKKGAITTVDGSTLVTQPAAAEPGHLGMAPTNPSGAGGDGPSSSPSSEFLPLPTTGQANDRSLSEDQIAQLRSMGYGGGSVGGTAIGVSSKSKGNLTGRGRKDQWERSEVAASERVAVAEAEVVADGHRQPPDSCIYWRVQPTPGTEYYAPIVEQGFASPIREPLSTFSSDVDTASYANVRRFLNNGQLPPVDAVRIEELVNYFEYDYPAPDGEVPFATHVAVTDCPWARQHRLVRIGIKGREVPAAERAASNLVFLLDVSGSMNQPDKLPLLVASLKLLTGQLDERDHVAIVTYAGNAGLQLESTKCDGPGRSKVIDVLDRLGAGGSTAGAAGIQLAYQIASGTFLKGGTNRVILATDGDFNVGLTDRESLQRLIEDSARSGVFLSVLGFGEGNLKDGTAELLADKGNGNYSYIDSLDEGRRVLVHELGATLVTIAKDVKIQVEFNPGKVGAYRLIGYENRALAAEDFNNDKKDAGEIGAGHTVTALYEVVPVGVELVPGIDKLKYQAPAPAAVAAPQLVESPDLLTVKLRWKLPESDTSTKLELAVRDSDGTLAQAGPDASFSAAVAAFGMLLRGSAAAGDANWDSVIALAEQGRGADKDGYRAEFIRLAQVAKGLASR